MRKVTQKIAARTRRMRALGVPLDPATSEPTYTVRQSGGSIASLYMGGGDKPTYWCEISSYLVIILKRKAPLVINDVGLTLPWARPQCFQHRRNSLRESSRFLGATAPRSSTAAR